MNETTPTVRRSRRSHLRSSDAVVRGRSWRLPVVICIVLGITACAPPGVDTDAAAAGSQAIIAQIAETIGQHADVVCADGRISTVFFDAELPTRVFLRIYVEDVGHSRMVELVREAATAAWESDLEITSMGITTVDRFEDRNSNADDIVVTLKDAYPELANLDSEFVFDLDELEPILGPRTPDLAAVVGRQRPEGRICPPILDSSSEETRRLLAHPGSRPTGY